MQDKYWLAITGILIIGCIEVVAMIKGLNGTYLSLTVGAIGSIIGAVVGITINIKKKSE